MSGIWQGLQLKNLKGMSYNDIGFCGQDILIILESIEH